MHLSAHPQHPVLTKTSPFYLHCLSPAPICFLHWEPSLPASLLAPNQPSPCSRQPEGSFWNINHREPALHLESFNGFQLYLKQNSQFSVWLLKRLIIWVLPTFPAQPWASLPCPHSRPTMLTCIQLLDHGRAKLSWTHGFTYAVLSTGKALPPISMLGWHLPINQVPAESVFLRVAFFKHFPLSQTQILSIPVVLYLFRSSSHS